MQRRQFVQAIGASGLLSAAEVSKAPGFYLLTQYFLRNGSQTTRIADYMKQGLLEACARLNVPGPRVIMEAVAAPHTPQLATIAAFASLEEMKETRARLAADGKHQAALAQWEAGDEAPYESFSEALLEATPYAPPFNMEGRGGKPPAIFELRLYHSPTRRQLKLLHERFAGPEIKIFHRSGVLPILYSSTLVGPLMPNLVYLIPFDDLAAREKAWATFGADPEWVKVRAESIARGGQISISSQISLYKATAYSPLR